MNLKDRIERDLTKKRYTLLDYFLWFVAVCVLCVVLFYNGCAHIETTDINITRTISCPVQPKDTSCQKCHNFKKEIGGWYNTKDGGIDKVEIILPINVNIDFKMCIDTTVINAQGGGEWVCMHTFKSFKEGFRAVQILYNRWGLSGRPPSPPLAITQIITLSPYSDDSIGEASYWIYHNGVPIEVDENEFYLYTESLKSREMI